MKLIDMNTRLTDSYLALLKNLTPNNKLDLIAKLTQLLKDDMKAKNNTFLKAFGAWEGKENADDLANQIKDSRYFARKTESL